MNDFQHAGAVATKIVNRWAWWQEALKGNFGQASESHPEQGYFRCRRKDGQWEPVAIWFDEESGKWLAYRNGREARDVNELWVWSMRQPITHAAYEKAMAGGGFDDEPPAPIGHNQSDDPFDALRAEYLGEKELAEQFLKSPIKSQADADKAAIWARRLADIANKAVGLHKIEKQPSLDEGRRIDERWRELKEDPKALSTKLKRHQDDWLNEQDRIERERQRRAREEAERIRQAAEAAEREAQTAAMVDDREAERRKAEAERLARQAHEAERAAEARNVSAGRTGARTSLRTFKSAEIFDFDVLFASLKDNAEVRELVKSLADKAAKAGFPLPGTKILEERRAV